MAASPKIHRLCPSRRIGRFHRWRMLVALAAIAHYCHVSGGAGAARGPLRVSPLNPRYFCDDTGSIVYVSGSHTWATVQDNGETAPPPPMDFEAFLDLLEQHNHNFIRLWRSELIRWTTKGTPAHPPTVRYAAQHPWQRTGPGVAMDDAPRFDLSRFDAAFFQRLRSRAETAGRRGMYVSLMLFEGWGMQFVPNAWASHPFHPANNINGVAYGPKPDEFGAKLFTLENSAVVRLQEAYVRHVIDSVNDLDNIVYEISNENTADSIPWQYHFINYIRNYEKRKPKQHLIGMTSEGFGGGDDTDALMASPADWVSLSPDKFDYKTNPPAATGEKVIISDTDHLWGVGGGSQWVWKSFLRGLNPIFMDPYNDPKPYAAIARQTEGARRSMGDTRRFADRIGLAEARPHDELSSTGYCLAVPGRRYLVYQPTAGEPFTVQLAPGRYRYEWFDTQHSSPSKTGRLPMVSGRKSFQPPVDAMCVLLLERIEEDAR